MSFSIEKGVRPYIYDFLFAGSSLAEQPLYSSRCYFILLGDYNLVSGRPGVFNILVARSHRVARLC